MNDESFEWIPGDGIVKHGSDFVACVAQDLTG
jgi:hypothetical protein